MKTTKSCSYDPSSQDNYLPTIIEGWCCLDAKGEGCFGDSDFICELPASEIRRRLESAEIEYDEIQERKGEDGLFISFHVRDEDYERAKELIQTKLQCANAYELEQAAFDSACDYRKDTIDYIQEYAENVFGILVDDEVAQKILNCRKALDEANDKSGEWQHNRYQHLQEPLEQIKFN